MLPLASVSYSLNVHASFSSWVPFLQMHTANNHSLTMENTHWDWNDRKRIAAINGPRLAATACQWKTLIGTETIERELLQQYTVPGQQPLPANGKLSWDKKCRSKLPAITAITANGNMLASLEDVLAQNYDTVAQKMLAYKNSHWIESGGDLKLIVPLLLMSNALNTSSCIFSVCLQRKFKKLF